MWARGERKEVHDSDGETVGFVSYVEWCDRWFTWEDENSADTLHPAGFATLMGACESLLDRGSSKTGEM